jgi:SAM-dependent methyltransferase
MSLIVRALLGLNRLSPGFRRHLPDPALRALYLSLFRNEEVRRIRAKESRIWFEQQVIRPLAAMGKISTVLFVGVEAYTWSWVRLLVRKHVRLITLDVDPRKAIWGAPHHLVGQIQDVDRSVHPASIDVVVVNGVFGWGVDHADEMERSLQAIHRILQPSGYLVLGWNMGGIPDPATLPTMCRLFTPADGLGITGRKGFPDDSQVYQVFSPARAASAGSEHCRAPAGEGQPLPFFR